MSVMTIISKTGHSLEQVAKKSRLFYSLALVLLASQYFVAASEATRADLYIFGFIFTKITVDTTD
jgi:glutathione S-transferase